MLSIDPEREAAGRTVATRLVAKEIRHGGRIHLETVLTEIGALAGFAAQMSIRKSIIEPQKLDPDEILPEVVTTNGEKYYFSDTLNWIVFENVTQPPYSVWGYVLDAVPQASRASLPDMEDIVSYAARTIGTARFGVPRLPAAHMPRKTPRAALAQHWTGVLQELRACGRKPSDWPYDLAFAARWQMLNGRDRLALPLAATIVMEAAIPMSKVDPKTVPGA
jgi:hypothetical protein